MGIFIVRLQHKVVKDELSLSLISCPPLKAKLDYCLSHKGRQLVFSLVQQRHPLPWPCTWPTPATISLKTCCRYFYIVLLYLLVDVGTLLRGLKISLDLAELGEIESGDLLGLLDLLLVALHLVLQLVHQLLHPLMVLGVLNMS